MYLQATITFVLHCQEAAYFVFYLLQANVDCVQCLRNNSRVGQAALMEIADISECACVSLIRELFLSIV